MRPFEQLRFRDVPEHPRVAHRYFEIPARDVLVPFEGHEVRIHVRELGEGPPLLLVHGLMTTSYSFRYVAHRFAEKFRVILFDLPGCGRSETPMHPIYGPRSMASFIGALIDRLGIRGCGVLGNSMGGYLCMWLALSQPDAMSRLLNLHSPTKAELRNQALKIAIGMPGSLALLRMLIRRDPLRWAHRNVHYYDETLKSLEEAREYGLPLATDEGSLGFHRILKETIAPHGFLELERELRRLDRFPIPLLLLYARADPMVPPHHGDHLRRLIPDARFEWLEGGSHFAHVDAPDRVMEIALPFFT